jgi:hypothetical protein
MYNLYHWPPEDERMTLETCRGTTFYVIYIKIVYQVGINKGITLRCTAYQISRETCTLQKRFKYDDKEMSFVY